MAICIDQSYLPEILLATLSSIPDFIMRVRAVRRKLVFVKKPSIPASFVICQLVNRFFNAMYTVQNAFIPNVPLGCRQRVR